jgi:uncharacterized membrane protein
MHSERGFHRLVNFSDAVVAIAITLLILPLVDSATAIGSAGLGHFLDRNQDRLWAFGLSFVVIGSFWWGQHQAFERVKSYSSLLVSGMFVWMFSIVFLPFPTELLGSARQSNDAGVHALYVGTMVLTAFGALLQQWAIKRQGEGKGEGGGGVTLDSSVVLFAFMTAALVLVIAIPSLGLWPLVVLVLSRPVEFWLARRRSDHDEQVEREPGG